MYNKEEKILKNANKVLKPEEEFGQYNSLKERFNVEFTGVDLGVYGNQGKKIGNFPNIICITLGLTDNDCNLFREDYASQIYR